MTLSQFKNHIDHLAGCVNFTYNDYPCGVDPMGRTKYDMWYGDNAVTVDSVEKVLNTKFFDGQSLTDIWGDVTDLDY